MISRAEYLYAIGCLIAAVLLLGSAGALETGIITFEQGIWQLAWALILGLWCSNGIRLEECRAAHSRRCS